MTRLCTTSSQILCQPAEILWGGASALPPGFRPACRKRAANPIPRWALALFLFTPAALAQNASVARASVAAAPIAVTRIPQLMLQNLEKNFDDRLAILNTKDPIDMLGTTRALYIPGFGTVFTTEVSLIVSPGQFPIAGSRYTPALKAEVHRRKEAQIPKLEETMKEMVNVTARTLVSMPDDQKIVLAVRLRYLSAEDSTGLPAQIVMTADKKAAQMGDIKTEIE